MTAEMTIVKDNGNEIVAKGRIKAVMVSKETGRSTEIPSEFREAIHKCEKTQVSSAFFLLAVMTLFLRI